MPIINEYDALTDSNVTVEISETELSEMIGDVSNNKSFEEILAENAAAKAGAQAKLAALGLTTEDLKALGL